MQKILIGLVALLVLATVVGTATHWVVGVAFFVFPVVAIYVRLKLSPKYRSATDKTMSETLGS